MLSEFRYYDPVAQRHVFKRRYVYAAKGFVVGLLAGALLSGLWSLIS